MDDYIDELVEGWVDGPQPNASGKGPSFPELVALLAAEELGKDTTYEGVTVLAKVVEVHDGDTVRIRFWDRGVVVQLVARLAGVDAPELRPKRDAPWREAEMEAARAARDALATMVGGALVFVECGPFDKYGRLLATLRRADLSTGSADPETVNDWMLAKGHGAKYSGGKKASFAPRHGAQVTPEALSEALAGLRGRTSPRALARS